MFYKSNHKFDTFDNLDTTNFQEQDENVVVRFRLNMNDDKLEHIDYNRLNHRLLNHKDNKSNKMETIDPKEQRNLDETDPNELMTNVKWTKISPLFRFQVELFFVVHEEILRQTVWSMSKEMKSDVLNVDLLINHRH